MESNGNEEVVIRLLRNIIRILSENNAKEWAISLEKLLQNYINADNKKEAIVPIMQTMLGGAGSLSDLVLHKDQQPLIEENNKLYELLNQLYSECKTIKTT